MTIMTIEDYNVMVKEIETECYNSKEELMKSFVRANNPYKAGDKVTDHIGTILVEKIGFAWGAVPCAIYSGIELRKDGTPNKRGTRRQVWQSNLI